MVNRSMLEDKQLIWNLRNGSPEALGRIYEKYHGYLLTLAIALLNDVNTAEDAIHDFFVSFARSGRTLKLEGSLKAYLATCVANRARDRLRAAKRQPAGLERAESIGSPADCPASTAVCNETLRQVNGALAAASLRAARGRHCCTHAWTHEIQDHCRPSKCFDCKPSRAGTAMDSKSSEPF